MKKRKVFISIILVLAIIVSSMVSTFAVSSVNVTDEQICENKIAPDLQSVLKTLDENDNVKVAVWLNDIESKEKDEGLSNKLFKEKERGKISEQLYSKYTTFHNATELQSQYMTLDEVQMLSSIKRSSYKELHIDRNIKWKDDVNETVGDVEVVYSSQYAPVVFIETSKLNVNSIAISDEVEYIYLWNDELEPTDDDNQTEQCSTDTELTDYGVWQDITNICDMRDGMGYDGEGIKIGVLELGVPDVESAPLVNSDITIVNEKEANKSDHATNTATILVGNTTDFIGVVPKASLYCAGYEGGYDYPLEQLLNYNINILSISNGLSSFPADTYGYWSEYIDYIVYNYNITVCIAAGNTGMSIDGVPGCAMAYNTITVGNLDDKNTLTYSDDETAVTSCYVSSDMVPYKPDLCAPGARVATPIFPERTNSSDGGTSSATPVVSGICAMLMQSDPSLVARPMLMKSILMSSANRIPNMDSITSTSTTIVPALSRRYGAGLVDATRAFTIADRENWDYIPLVTADQSQNPYVVNVVVSQDYINSSKKIAACLCWTQKVLSTSLGYSTVYDVYHHDLGVYDPNGNLIAYSDYRSDRKQFVYFQPNVAGTYQIKVYKTGIAQAGVLTAISYDLS